jgi:hypothetical protein
MEGPLWAGSGRYPFDYLARCAQGAAGIQLTLTELQRRKSAT